jgi:hypothetical protein
MATTGWDINSYTTRAKLLWHDNLSKWTQMSLETLRSWLPGIYSNRAQAHADPAWFIPVRLWYVLVDQLFATGVGFFTEQVSEHTPNQPYRSRVLQLLDQPLRLENYRLRDQDRWSGAAQDPTRLARLTLQDLIYLPDCTISLTQEANRYMGKIAGKGCRLSPESTSYVQIEFELTARTFISLDRGFDCATDAQVWGTKAGPYHYQKMAP